MNEQAARGPAGEQDEWTTRAVRAAIGDRAIWLGLLYRAFSEALPESEVERLARKAMFEYGRLRAKRDPADFTPHTWPEVHVASRADKVFASTIEKGEGYAVQNMHHCPLVAGWKEMGCSDDEIRRLCDISTEGDRGRAQANGIAMEMEERISRGDKACKLRLFER
ncbi:MAG: L-2-amino-thiazoline-4-carboxylic acid hydrolase [Burkholderiales bacterium]